MNTRVDQLETENNAQQAEIDAMDARVTDLEVCPASAPTRYVDNGDGTICDNKTGLMWEKKLAADGSDGGHCAHTNPVFHDVRCVNSNYSWTSLDDGDDTNSDGTAFTVFLSRLNQEATRDENSTCFANHCDWRIPRLAELRTLPLQSLVCSTSYCIHPIFGPTTAQLGYWSSSSSDPGTGRLSHAWFASQESPDLPYVLIVYREGNKPSSLYVRAVRGSSRLLYD